MEPGTDSATAFGFTTESALLEWAATADARLDQMAQRVNHVQDVLFGVIIALIFHCVLQCLCPEPARRYKPYKH